MLSTSTGGLIGAALADASEHGKKGLLPLISGLCLGVATIMLIDLFIAFLEKRSESIEHADMEGDEARMRLAEQNACNNCGSEQGTVMTNVGSEAIAVTNDALLEHEHAGNPAKSSFVLIAAMAIHHIPEALAVGVAASAASLNEISEGQCAFERVDIHEDLDSLGCHGTSKYS